ncbi:hypothetical protein [Streptomyces sp. G-G2]|uniref:hypothetical protein n=1 Tax=Streptomyces sp. G-G2 TaxID=3046201 RepID=UPI0024BBDCDA|nr:hypothetical protein [Streptomyces sp. G-G2]MDJ0382473.1 hypothetical protein [Streptomyces sp. G-G2]
MRHLTRRTAGALAAAAAVLALASGCSGAPRADGADSADSAGDPAGSVAPVALPAPRGAPEPAAVLASPAAAGEVRVEEGPFTDRVKLTSLKLTSLKPTGKAAVAGHLAITSDVSDVLALEVRAAYYDASGHLLGTGTFQYQEEGEDAKGGDHHDGPRAAADGIDFTVAADGQFAQAPTSAVLSVPVLVNE